MCKRQGPALSSLGPSWKGKCCGACWTHCDAGRGAPKRVPETGGGPAAAGRRGDAGPAGGSLPLPRDVIHLFVSSNFRSSSSALMLHRQAVPDFLVDMLLESSVTSILGDDGALRGRRQRLLWPRHPIVFSWGAVTPPVPWTAPHTWPVGLPLVHPKHCFARGTIPLRYPRAYLEQSSSLWPGPHLLPLCSGYTVLDVTEQPLTATHPTRLPAVCSLARHTAARCLECLPQ